MSDFWDSFTDGAEASIETMGETVFIGSIEMQAVVQPVETAPRTMTGGLSKGVTHLLQVSLNAGEAVGDGDTIESRMLKGKVYGKTHFGGGWLIQGGPENRAGDADWE